MARLDGFLWSSAETQETRVQPDLPGDNHPEMSAPRGDSHRGPVRDTPGPQRALTAPVKACLTSAMDGGIIFCFQMFFGIYLLSTA